MQLKTKIYCKHFEKDINDKKWKILTYKAATNVKATEVNTNIVAINLVDANIFLN